MEIMSVKEKVEKVLLSRKDARDNDMLLVSLVWRSEFYSKHKYMETDAMRFFDALEGGELSHPESIMRCRRHLQADNPDLRGKNYNYKQIQETKKVKEELGYSVDQATPKVEKPIDNTLPPSKQLDMKLKSSPKRVKAGEQIGLF